jgi:hypothetical protein
MGVALYDASTQPVINLLFIQMCQYYVLKNRVSIKVVLSLHHLRKFRSSSTRILKFSQENEGLDCPYAKHSSIFGTNSAGC